ncbi:MAG: triose-phosphate isomerase [Gemmatimonadaceae bacterium]|jgi:triosephosphate isomerase|nr:triose-phosphate isomerase [Gemmatimonadaceae bacterium]
MSTPRRPIFAANWKMNHGASDARRFMKQFLAQNSRANDRSLLFFPSALALQAAMDEARDRADVGFGVQNVHTDAQGAFTGENSALMVRDIGAKYVLVGHSERRHVFGETDEATGKKVAIAIQARLTPMLCVGELLSEREAGQTEAVVRRQLAAGLAGIDAAEIPNVLIAYEPVWAIGTGKTAMPTDAAEIHGVLRAALRDRVGDRAGQMAILYGGSVNRGNVEALLGAGDVDGVLVGGASLDPDGWASIVRV